MLNNPVITESTLWLLDYGERSYTIVKGKEEGYYRLNEIVPTDDDMSLKLNYIDEYISIEDAKLAAFCEANPS